MKRFKTFLSVVLIVLNVFLALTGAAGGIVLLAGWYAPPLDQLQGSIFKDFTIPGLSLFLFVGGSALLAAILLVRKNKFALLASMAAAIIIMFFEFVEVLVIGSPPGAALTLQLFYYGLGTLITIVTSVVWFIDLRG